jgi:hypothetical protein
LIDTFRRYFNPPIEATQEIGVALLFVSLFDNAHQEPVNDEPKFRRRTYRNGPDHK